MTEAHPPTYPSGIPRPVVSSAAGAEVLVLTGMSGAGRTRAAGVLGDLGWYVVDNLPPHMVSDLVSTLVVPGKITRLAAVVDARGGPFFADLEPVVKDLEAHGCSVNLVFLDADDASLVRRFEEARRPHPLQADGTILEGIQRERDLVAPIRDDADLVIDTSYLSIHDLRDIITERLAQEAPATFINIVSFGYKNGLPADADFVADVRFLPNPHWDPELRALTGLEAPVREFVLDSDGASEFLADYSRVLDAVLSRFRAHHRPSVSIAVGCTGGKHRSVAMAEALAARLRAVGHEVRVTHRDRPQL